jgi:cyclase
VKTRQFSDPVYVGDPVNVLSIFNSFEVDEIVILDIEGPARGGPADPDLLRQCAEECFIPLAYGGGLRAMGELSSLFAIGFEKAVLNTALAAATDLVRDAVREFGSQAIVASIDVRGPGSGGSVVVEAGRSDTGADPVTWARRAQELGVGEILITSVDREGTMEGYDLDLVEAVASAVDVPVIAHGGAGRRSDLVDPVAKAGASAVAAGSLFVFQRSRESVLVNYPTRTQLERLFKDVASGDDE